VGGFIVEVRDVDVFRVDEDELLDLVPQFGW
jgi:hypothetical protein